MAAYFSDAHIIDMKERPLSRALAELNACFTSKPQWHLSELLDIAKRKHITRTTLYRAAHSMKVKRVTIGAGKKRHSVWTGTPDKYKNARDGRLTAYSWLIAELADMSEVANTGYEAAVIDETITFLRKQRRRA